MSLTGISVLAHVKSVVPLLQDVKHFIHLQNFSINWDDFVGVFTSIYTGGFS